MKEKKFGLSSLFLKIIACLLMTLDHIALLFFESGYPNYNTLYYVFRAIGKISFPIFVFLAFIGAYKTKNIKFYLLRIGFLAILMDGFGYILGAVSSITIATNPLIGNAFTDMFMGILLVTLLKRKDKYSVFSILPLLYEIFSDYTINDSYGTLFKSDWGSFSIILFLMLFIFKEIFDLYLKNKAIKDGVSFESYELNDYIKYSSCIALITTELLFYLIYRLNYTAFILPNEFVPIGSYSTLAFIFILLYNGNKGYSSKKIQYSFYLYYPVHILILGILSLSFGLLS